MKNTFTCDCEQVHEDIVEEVEAKLPHSLEMNKVCNLFKLIAEPTRLKLLIALGAHEMCVCDLSVLLSMTKSAVSHQLKLLRENGLVKFRKDGKIVFYSLADHCIEEIVSDAFGHAAHMNILAE
jgi:ArsR family transcriptional regulator